MATNSPGHPGVIAVRTETGDTPTDLTMPDELEGLKVALFVWDADGLEWVRMRQPQISPLADDLPLDTRFAYNPGGTLKYKSINATHKALTSATNWLNWKYSWDIDNPDTGKLTRIEGPLEGSVDNIDNLGWA